MRGVFAVGLLATLLAFGCGDDEGGGSDASVDTSAGSDATADGEVAWVCLQISICKQECGDPETAVACAAECESKGCESAKTTAAAVQACTLDKCETECADPKADGCATCVQTQCSADLTACIANTCP